MEKDYEKAILFGGDIQFTAKGKTFTVKPLSLEYIANGEFRKSGLCFPKDRASSSQVLNLADEAQRSELDKWLKRLVFYKGKPISLKQVIRWDWSIADDIVRLIDFVMEISGLSFSESVKEETDKDIDWFPLMAFVQSKGHMRRDEILAAPLFLLNSLNAELYKIMQSELAGSLNASMLGMLGGGSGQSPQSKISAEYDNFFADCRSGGDPRMGETPQFKSRDEYFAFMNQHR